MAGSRCIMRMTAAVLSASARLPNAKTRSGARGDAEAAHRVKAEEQRRQQHAQRGAEERRAEHRAQQVGRARGAVQASHRTTRACRRCAAAAMRWRQPMRAVSASCRPWLFSRSGSARMIGLRAAGPAPAPHCPRRPRCRLRDSAGDRLQRVDRAASRRAGWKRV